MEQTEIFSNWLDGILSFNPFPANTMAVNFNLYEMDDSFDVQLIGSSMYDEDNDDWACEETFSSEENARYSSMTRDNFLGFGCSATTLLKNQFKINTFSVDEYLKRIKENPMAKQVKLADFERTITSGAKTDLSFNNACAMVELTMPSTFEKRYSKYEWRTSRRFIKI